MHSSLCIFVALVYILQLSDAKLPTFINRCRLSDPEINTCILESVNTAEKHIIAGVEELQIPPLTTVKLPILQSVDNESFVLTFDGNLEGIENIIYENVTFLKEYKGTAQFSIPKIKLVGNYTINGNLEDIPVNSEGNCTIKFDHISITYEYALTIYTKDGLNYLKANVILISYDMADNGNHKFIGRDEANEKKMWNYFSKGQPMLKNVLGPVMAENVLKIVLDVANKIFATAPMDEVFLP